MTDPTGITIRRPVALLARVTPALKRDMKADIRGRLERLDLELRQLVVQEKRLLEGHKDSTGQQLDNVTAELRRQQDRCRQEMRDLLARERSVSDLELGSEIRQGSAEALAQISVGDRWSNYLNWEIVLEDGVVVAIRQGESEAK